MASNAFGVVVASEDQVAPTGGSEAKIPGTSDPKKIFVT